MLKLKEALQLDFRVKGSKNAMIEMLQTLPFFSVQEPTMDGLEAAMQKMQNKYPVSLSYIMRGPDRDNYYSFMIKRSDNNEWIHTVYARSMFEGFAKTVLVMFGYIKKNFKKE